MAGQHHRRLRRRDALVLGAAAAAWPAIALAHGERRKRVGVLMGYAEHDPEAAARLAAFVDGLRALNWREGQNVDIHIRWAAGDAAQAGADARELIALRPDVIVANTTPVTAALLKQTRTIPIVFNVVSDPVGSGFVQSFARPGTNVTGFVNLEQSIIQKWAQLLKEIAPAVDHATVMFNPKTAPYAASYYLPAVEAVAPSVHIKLSKALVGDDHDIEQTVEGLAREPGAGLIVMTDAFTTVHRKTIIAAAARYRTPAIFSVGISAREGGLMSYGVHVEDLFRRTAAYVDKILRGADPADLPVQLPTKFELIINLKTAKGLGLNVPQSLLLSSDEVIE